MSGNRKFLRDQVRNNIKEAKKKIPKEYRAAVTFSQVYEIIKNESKVTKQNTDE